MVRYDQPIRTRYQICRWLCQLPVCSGLKKRICPHDNRHVYHRLCDFFLNPMAHDFSYVRFHSCHRICRLHFYVVSSTARLKKLKKLHPSWWVCRASIKCYKNCQNAEWPRLWGATIQKMLNLSNKKGFKVCTNCRSWNGLDVWYHDHVVFIGILVWLSLRISNRCMQQWSKIHSRGCRCYFFHYLNVWL